MEEKKIKIYSYTKVWRVEKKIYAIANIVLPTPINPYDLLSFVGVALFILVLGYIIPAITAIPTVLRFVAVPYLVTTYLMKQKLDGKNPIMYMLGCIKYFLTVRSRYIQTFKTHANKSETINLNWKCSVGRQK